MSEPGKTDVFLTHDWGKDELGRSNHDRVAVVNEALKELGYKTWFDSDRMTGDILNQMATGIDNTKVILVFVTQRYAQKVGGSNEKDNCKLEFQYAARVKGKALMIPIIMEDRMKRPGEWIGPIGLILGGELAVRMSYEFSDSEKFKAGIAELKDEIDSRLDKLHSTCSSETGADSSSPQLAVALCDEVSTEPSSEPSAAPVAGPPAAHISTPFGSVELSVPFTAANPSPSPIRFSKEFWQGGSKLMDSFW